MKTTKTSLLILILLSIMVITFSCTPPPPPTVDCSTLTVDQIEFGNSDFPISTKNGLDWGLNTFKIQLMGTVGSQDIYPEIILSNGIYGATPPVGTYTYTSNPYELSDTTTNQKRFMFVVSYSGLYDYLPDSTATNTLEITDVTGNNVDGCLIGRVMGSDVRDLKVKFVDVPF